MLNFITTKIPKSWIVMSIILLALVGYIYLQKFRMDNMENDLYDSYSQIGNLNSKIDILEKEVIEQNNSIKLMKQNFDDVAEINSQLQKAIVSIREDTNNVIRDYNSYKSRLRNITIEKPTLIERRVNNSTSDILREFENTTTRSIK